MTCFVSSLNLKYRFFFWQITDKENWFFNTNNSTHLRGEPGSLYYNIPTSDGQYETCGKEKNIHVQYFYNCKAGQNLRLNLDRDCWNRLKRDTKCCQCLDYRDRLHVLFFIRTLYMHQLTFKVLILLTSKGAKHQFKHLENIFAPFITGETLEE